MSSSVFNAVYVPNIVISAIIFNIIGINKKKDYYFMHKKLRELICIKHMAFWKMLQIPNAEVKKHINNQYTTYIFVDDFKRNPS